MLALCLVFATGHVAHAHPYVFWPRAAACSPQPKYAFVNTSDGSWTAAERDHVRNAVERWNFMRDYNNEKVVNVTEGTGGFEVVWKNNPGGSSTALGYMWLCKRIELNPVLKSDATLMRIVARHEMGHGLAAGHTGRYDSFDGNNPPTISTCVSAQRNWTRDDQASVIHHNTRLSPAHVHANVGFEHDLQNWGVSAATATVSTSNSKNGAKHARVTPTSSGNALYQTIRVALGGDSVEFDVSANARKLSSSASGQLRVELWSRGVWYKSGSAPCSYYGNYDYNVVQSVDPMTRTKYNVWSSGAVTTSWATFRSPEHRFPSGYPAVDVQARVVSTLQGSSGYVTVAVDDLRGRRTG